MQFISLEIMIEYYLSLSSHQKKKKKKHIDLRRFVSYFIMFGKRTENDLILLLQFLLVMLFYRILIKKNPKRIDRKISRCFFSSLLVDFLLFFRFDLSTLSAKNIESVSHQNFFLSPSLSLNDGNNPSLLVFLLPRSSLNNMNS